MTAIWFILAIMTAAAVLALLWPLRRRVKAAEAGQAGLATETGFYEDQLAEIDRDLARGLIAESEAEAARTEAARRLLRASREGRTADAAPIAEPHLRQRRAASAFALSTIPLVALLTYGLYGSPNLPSQTEADRRAVQEGGQSVMRAIGQVEAKLASDPNDARGWSVIAPVYMRIGRFDDAARAYQNLVRIKGEDPEQLANWGEALVAAGEGNVSPQARKLFERALVLDPKAAKPQFYLARGDELAGDAAGAARRLEALAAQGPADAPWMGTVRENLSRLKGAAGPAAEAAKPAPKPEAKADATPDAPSAEAPASGPAANIQALPPAERMSAIRGMVEGLDRRLSAQGGTVEEWSRLVRSYGALGERDKALAALERARKTLADKPEDRDRLDAEARELGLASAGETPPEAGKGAGKGAGKEAGKGVGQPETAAPDMPPGSGGADAAAAIKAMPPAEREAMIRHMVERLDQRLAAKGGNADEWMRLVRSYSALGDRPRAVQALDRAKMALAADVGAVGRLDALGKELDLRTADVKR